MRYITAGESHSDHITSIVEDVPYGVSLKSQDIDLQLKRRSSGYGRSARQEEESNKCEITAGVSNDRTTGAPVCVAIPNACVGQEKSKQDLSATLPQATNTIARVGHADLGGALKYNVDNVDAISERASARETAARVPAFTIAKNFLAELGVEVFGFVTSIGSVKANTDLNITYENVPDIATIETDELRCPDAHASKEMHQEIDRAISVGDTLGGTFTVCATGLVPGLGGFSSGCDRLEAKIAQGILSIPSVKGMNIGSTDKVVSMVGSAVLDQIISPKIVTPEGAICRLSNNSGGLEGGMTTGIPLVVSGSVKPVPTVSKPVNSMDVATMQVIEYTSQIRHDTCVVPSVSVIAEGEVAISLANAYMQKFGCDTISDIKDAVEAYKQRLKLMHM